MFYYACVFRKQEWGGFYLNRFALTLFWQLYVLWIVALWPYFDNCTNVNRCALTLFWRQYVYFLKVVSLHEKYLLTNMCVQEVVVGAFVTWHVALGLFFSQLHVMSKRCTHFVRNIWLHVCIQQAVMRAFVTQVVARWLYILTAVCIYLRNVPTSWELLNYTYVLRKQ